MSTYGWRAYALPVLVAVTGVVLYQTVTGTSASAPASGQPVQGPPKIGAVGTVIIGAPPSGLTQFDASLPTGMLPNGGPFTEAGAKSWHVVPGVTPQVGQGTAKVFNYTVEVENGMDPTAFGGDDAFAAMVDQTLANPKSWTHDAQFAFVRVDANGRSKPDYPHLAELADDRSARAAATSSRSRRPATTRLTGPGSSRGSSSTRHAGCAARCPSRATSVPTGST